MDLYQPYTDGTRQLRSALPPRAHQRYITKQPVQSVKLFLFTERSIGRRLRTLRSRCCIRTRHDQSWSTWSTIRQVETERGAVQNRVKTERGGFELFVSLNRICDILVMVKCDRTQYLGREIYGQESARNPHQGANFVAATGWCYVAEYCCRCLLVPPTAANLEALWILCVRASGMLSSK